MKLVPILFTLSWIFFVLGVSLFYKKKIGDFLFTIILGLMPGELWDGEILILDAIYCLNMVEASCLSQILFSLIFQPFQVIILNLRNIFAEHLNLNIL